MTRSTLIRRNLLYFWRSHAATAAGLATAVAVLTGALLVGDSVRESLRSIVVGRLGLVDVVLTGPGFVREALADDLLGPEVPATAPAILVEGNLLHATSGRRVGQVTVYGVDDRFWRFHNRDDLAPGPTAREAWLGAPLAAHLGAAVGDDVVLTVGRTDAIPAGVLQGRRDERGRLVRLAVGRTLDAGDLGEFSFAWQQAAPRVLFVPLSRLQRELEQVGRVNTVIVRLPRAADDGRGPATPEAHDALAERVRGVFALDDLGLSVSRVDERSMIALESASGFVAPAIAALVGDVASGLGLSPVPVLTYIANTLRVDGREIPYSVVSAMDLAAYDAASGGSDHTAAAAPFLATTTGFAALWLNAWAADDLAASVGDLVELDYFVWQDDSGLATESATFELVGIVPMSGAGADAALTPEYPGITGETRLADWDPPFPVDLGRIRDIDERYWDLYRAAPKAFVSLEAGQPLWRTRYGDVTSFRFGADQATLDRTRGDFEARLRAAIDPIGDGRLELVAARRDGLDASRGTTDFGEYFLYFSAFLMASALLLAGLFFRLGADQRSREIGLLRALGCAPGLVRRLLLYESAAIALVGTGLGLLFGLAYAWAIMRGLGTWWIGAVGTSALTLVVSGSALAWGAAGGLVTSFVVLAWALGRLVSVSPRLLLANAPGAEAAITTSAAAAATRRRAAVTAMALTTLAIALIAAATMDVVDDVGAFFGAGLAGLGAALAAFRLALGRGSSIRPSAPWRALTALGLRSAEFRPGRAVLAVALIAFATFVIVAVGAFRRDAGANPYDPRAGTGGFALLVETTVPVMHDPNAPAGRDEISPIPPPVSLDDTHLWRLRLRPGDDGSCVNLYRPKNPRLLGVPSALVDANRFSFSRSLAATDEEHANPWTLLDRTFDDGAVAAIVDQTSLTYVLHARLGDTFEIDRAPAPPIRLRFVAALADSVLQSEIMIAERDFLSLFPTIDGARVLLVDASPDRVAELSSGLESWLEAYGATAVSTTERLAGFHRVENTYLATFQALGGLGLLLGTFGVGLVLLRNVIEQRRELAVLRAVGYQPRHLSQIVIAESAWLAGWGLAAGTLTALVAVVPALAARAQGWPVLSLAALVAGVGVVALASSLAAARRAARAPIIAGLRTE